MNDTITLGPQTLPLDALRESPENPRTIDSERFEALKRSLTNDPSMIKARPVVCTPDGEVVAGNMRLRAVRELGWSEVDVFVAELTDTQKREWMLRDNQSYGEYVPDQLARLIALHEQDGGDLSMLGFPEDQLTDLLKSLEAGEAVIPEPDEQSDPQLPGEVMIEIYCTRAAYEIEVTAALQGLEGVDGVEINVTA